MYYSVYHPENNQLNTQCLRGQHEYKMVAVVKAESLEEAFMKAQNDFNEEYLIYNVRSTSVGDIIQDVKTGLYYIVEGTGFTEIPFTVVSYKDWSNPVVS
jgi:hypothetical protein